MFNNNLGDIFQIEELFKFFVKDVLYVINHESDPLVSIKKNLLLENLFLAFGY